MELDAQVAMMKARVDRNESDVSKLIESVSITRAAGIELTALLQNLDHSIQDYSKTLYGNGNRQNSLVTIADTLVVECSTLRKEIEDIKKISSNTLEIANTAKSVSETSFKASENFKTLLEGNVVQFGRFKLYGKAANAIAIMVIPMMIFITVASIIYFILALMGKVPWPWG